MIERIDGFKAFNKDKTNRYGLLMEAGNTYSVTGDIKFGVHGNGFHMCSRLEDTLRYFDAMNDEIEVADVTGFGEYVKRDDEYFGFYDMYAVEHIRINRFLDRDEIISYFLSLYPYGVDRVNRFISLFRLTDDEKELFKRNYANYISVLEYIDYYQGDNKEGTNRVKTYGRIH